jgi:hypothetical protein
MLKFIFANTSFWIAFLLPLILTGVVFRRTHKSWNKRYAGADKIDEFSSDAFRDSINITVGIAAIVGPLAAALIGYLYTVLSLEAKDLAIPVAGLLHIGLAIFIGLWNSFSLITQVDKNGVLIIKKGYNTAIPALITSQFTLLILGLMLFSGYALLGWSPDVETSHKPISQATYPIQKPPIFINMSRDEVDRLWGAPCNSVTSGKTIEYTYQSVDSIFKISIENDQVAEIVQTKVQEGSICP